MTNPMNRNPYRAAFAAMTLCLAVACSPAAEVKVDAKAEQEKALQTAMQADRDFAAMSAKDGPKAAFLAYMDPADGEFIGPGSVVKSAAQIADGFSQSPPGFAIAWTPDGGHGSASGDLAVTTGLYTIRAGADTLEQGRYVTVWRKDAAGALKAVMDLGVADPPPQTSTVPTPERPNLEGRPG